MDGDDQKSNKNILPIIIFLIIVVLLFTVNIKSLVKSSAFQTNINYIEQKASDIWDNYISKYFLSFWSSNNTGLDVTNISNTLTPEDIKKGIDAITKQNQTQ